MPLPLTESMLKQCMPGATMENIRKYLPYLNTYMEEFQINTDRRIAAFLGQIAAESADLYYTSEISPRNYDFRADLGNTSAGDGMKFKGRGLIQLTGKANYRAYSMFAFGDETLLNSPEILNNDPEHAVQSACWFWAMGRSMNLNGLAENGDYNAITKAINGGYNGYTKRVQAYNQANAALGTGIYFEGDPNITNDSQYSKFAQEIYGEAGADYDVTGLNPSSLDFTKIELNIENAEADVVNKSWGSRSNGLEESDFIGLKQYLLYLTSKLYPQSLVPFVELIPIFATEKATRTKDWNSQYKPLSPAEVITTGLERFGYNPKSRDERDIPQKEDTTFINEQRFDKTGERLLKLSEQGGTDLFTNDPFQESTSSFNVFNEEGEAINKARGYGYKIFGSINVSPAVQGGGLSKAGGVGLTGVEIEAGSQVHNGLTSVTVKIKDVLGNKFMDINSPWSLLLNARPGQSTADYYFRFGWQVRIPKMGRPDDEQGQRFWNHEGWKLFGSLNGEGEDAYDNGVEMKRYINSMAAKCDGYLTLTQSPMKEAMLSPGYSLNEDGRFVINRGLHKWMHYLPLSLVQPQLSVDPQDGSIEAVLNFRTIAAITNCIAPINGIGHHSKTKTAVNEAPDGNISLSDLMRVFVEDSNDYIKNNTSLKNVGGGEKSAFFTGTDMKSWLTVIGGAGTESYIDINPDTVIVKINQELLEKINKATPKDTTLLIHWVNEVLQENSMAIVSAGDKDHAITLGSATFNGGFVIAYDSEHKKGASGEVVSGKDLAAKDLTFGDFLEYTNNLSTNDKYVGKRLEIQDDVFAFRFQGSLVESITIDKQLNPSESTILINDNLANQYGESSSAPAETNRRGVITKGSRTEEGIQKQNTPPNKVNVRDKQLYLKALLQTMLAVNIRAICHPWIKLCRPVYIKGMGIWDGKYMVTKVKHSFGMDGKFVSDINAYRILTHNQSLLDKDGRLINAMNNPNAKYASRVSPAIRRNAPRRQTPAVTQYVGDEINYLDLSDPTDIRTVQRERFVLRDELENELHQLHPDEKHRFRSFIYTYERQFPNQIIISSSYRTFAEQKDIRENPNNPFYDPQAAKPGYSMHNYGLAIDINVLMANGVLLRKSDIFVDGIQTSINADDLDALWRESAIVSHARKYGLIWGGTFFGYRDRVHFGLDATYDKNILYKMATTQFGSNVNYIAGNRIQLYGNSNNTTFNIRENLGLMSTPGYVPDGSISRTIGGN
jgi:putative chitinase